MMFSFELFKAKERTSFLTLPITFSYMKQFYFDSETDFFKNQLFYIDFFQSS